MLLVLLTISFYFFCWGGGRFIQTKMITRAQLTVSLFLLPPVTKKKKKLEV